MTIHEKARVVMDTYKTRRFYLQINNPHTLSLNLNIFPEEILYNERTFKKIDLQTSTMTIYDNFQSYLDNRPYSFLKFRYDHHPILDSYVLSKMSLRSGVD
jgi:hypothetical protein